MSDELGDVPSFESLTNQEDVNLDFSGSMEDASFPNLADSNTNFEDNIGGTDTEISFTEDNDSQEMLIDQVPNHSFWSIDYYAVYFNVSTKTVSSRLARSLLPFGGRSFYSKTEIPDLYGPFWVITTLIVILAITGNFASYLHFLPTDRHVVWQYDFEKVTIAASVFYTMITAVPIAVWFYLKKLGVSGSIPWLAHIISIYGYSFTIYLPAAFICITPMEIARWVTVLVSCAISVLFVTRNVWSYMPTNNIDWSTKTKAKGSMLMIVIAVLHFGVSLATKFYFFHYLTTYPDTTQPPTSAPVIALTPTTALAQITQAPALAPTPALVSPATAGNVSHAATNGTRLLF